MSKHGTNKKLGLQIHTYSNEGNPSGAISLRCFKKATGTYQGTQQYLGGINIKNTSELLEDIANKGSKSSLFRCGAEPWLTTLDPKVIDEAKHMLAQYEPQTVQKLEQILPQLEKNCPALAVLKQTTPFSKMKIQPVQNPTANVGTQQAVQKPTRF